MPPSDRIHYFFLLNNKKKDLNSSIFEWPKSENFQGP